MMVSGRLFRPEPEPDKKTSTRTRTRQKNFDLNPEPEPDGSRRQPDNDPTKPILAQTFEPQTKNFVVTLVRMHKFGGV